jgi:hypothetical protein
MCVLHLPIDEKNSLLFQCLQYTDNSVMQVKVKVTLEQATKAQRGSRGIALPFL